MNKLIKILPIVLAFVLQACGNGITEKVVSSYDNGQAAKVCYYDKQGDCIHEVDYYDDGAIYMEGDIKNNLRDGEWTAYFRDGKVQSKGFFKDDVRTGKALVYHENGHLYMEGSYDEGKRVGLWIYYDEQGYESMRVDFDKQ